MENLGIIKTGDLFKVDLSRLDTFQDAKNKQLKLVEECPYTEIVDGKSYDTAKRYRTALRTGRTDLEKGQKAIFDVVNGFKNEVKGFTEELIEITRPAEYKQQEEINRYETEKEAEKRRKEEEERKRKDTIKQSISDFRNRVNQSIATATVNTIDGVLKDITGTTLNCSEFQDDFEAIKRDLLQSIESRRVQLQREEEIKLQQEEIKKTTSRSIELKKWNFIYPGDDLGKISEEEFVKIRDTQRSVYMKEQERKAKEEEEKKRVEQEQREKAEALARKEAELKAEEERMNREKEERRKREEQEAIAAKEAEEKRIQAEKEAREKAEAEAREKARQEALKPDKQKITEILEGMALPEPRLSSPEMQQAWDSIRSEFGGFITKQVVFINNL